MKTNYWSLPTRLLHIGLVLTVSSQLAISLVMTTPDHKGSELSKMAFEAHEVVGLTALVIVLLHWAWSIFGQSDGGVRHLLPVSQASRKQVFTDIGNLKQGKLPATGNKGGLIGLIHGLGLLAVTGMVITGAFLFVLFPDSGEPGALAEFFAEIHESIAILVWTYWIGHGGMALLHHFKGHDILKNMFNLHLKRITDSSIKEPTQATSASNKSRTNQISSEKLE